MKVCLKFIHNILTYYQDDQHRVDRREKEDKT